MGIPQYTAWISFQALHSMKKQELHLWQDPVWIPLYVPVASLRTQLPLTFMKTAEDSLGVWALSTHMETSRGYFPAMACPDLAIVATGANQMIPDSICLSISPPLCNSHFHMIKWIFKINKWILKLRNTGNNHLFTKFYIIHLNPWNIFFNQFWNSLFKLKVYRVPFISL